MTNPNQSPASPSGLKFSPYLKPWRAANSQGLAEIGMAFLAYISSVDLLKHAEQSYCSGFRDIMRNAADRRAKAATRAAMGLLPSYRAENRRIPGSRA